MEDPSWRRHAGSEHELQTYASKAIHEEVDYLKEHDLDDIASKCLITIIFIYVYLFCVFLLPSLSLSHSLILTPFHSVNFSSMSLLSSLSVSLPFFPLSPSFLSLSHLVHPEVQLNWIASRLFISETLENLIEFKCRSKQCMEYHYIRQGVQDTACWPNISHQAAQDLSV